MVAIVHNGSSLRNALYYNENKVRKKIADCIYSGNFPKDTEVLSIKDKLNLLYNLAALNQQTKINSVHISLNFDVSDKPDNEKLRLISETYMQRIGFGEQPYLVYQHRDAGHPHLHIVTTNIRSDGTRIILHNLGRGASMKASKEIEKEFQLTVALNKSRSRYELQPINAQKVQYGKSETKRAITNVLDAVLPKYKYASLAELNAVLREYNILADRGTEDSRVFKNGGLVYRILNEQGERIGIPVKASLIYNKPMLSVIQEKFVKNKEDRQRFKQRIKTSVDLAFIKQPNISLASLDKALYKEGIRLHLRQNEAGVIYGLTYVDHKTKCVFNGSELGKQYSANAIQQRCENREAKLRKKFSVLQSQDLNVQAEGNRVTAPLSNIMHQLTTATDQSLSSELKEELTKKKERQKRQL